jgi:molybdopterin molybdotransferase
VPRMLSFDAALQAILESAPRLENEELPLEATEGRVLATSLIADVDIPAFNYSAMDGYALCFADLPASGPWKLEVAGESRTGHAVPAWKPGTACRIFTGAEVPAGADTVVMQENVTREGDTVRLEKIPARGEHIRKRGEDVPRGSIGLEAGTFLGPFQLALAAALDRAKLEVSRPPRVTVLCTGDELRDPGALARPGSIPESNGLALAGLARRAGAQTRLARRVGDDLESITAAIRAALDESDLVVTVGGASVGDHDLVEPALRAAGAEIEFWKVRIKPGKPLLYGKRGSARVLGVPGNPVSALVTFSLFGLPLIRRMQGAKSPTPERRRFVLAETFRQKPGRLGFQRARIEGERVRILPNQASGAANSMAWAEALVMISEDAAEVAAGTLVDTLLFAEL